MRWRASVPWYRIILVLLLAAMTGYSPAAVRAAVATTRLPIAAQAFNLEITGSAVDFNLSGMEPDFDPIYKVAVTATVHDTRRAIEALPDSTLVLLAYLEAFQPDTTPVLPDLLHTDQIATGLSGFLSGKAALVNRGGLIAYQGSLLAEIFQGNAEHLVIDLYPHGGGSAVRLQGVVLLARGGAEHGSLRALKPLDRSTLAVPRGRAPTWQQVITGMSVRKPAMMGTAGSAGTGQPAQPGTIAPAALTVKLGSTAACDTWCRVRRPVTLLPLLVGLTLAVAGTLMAMRSRRTRLRWPPRLRHDSA